MPVQEVGVKAIFDTADFRAGLTAYIRGINRAVTATNGAVTSLNNLAGAFTNAFTAGTNQAQTATAALQQVAAAARQATRATNQAAASPNNPALQGLERDLEIQRLIKNEIKDRISLEKQRQIIAAAGTSTLARQAAQAEEEMVRIFRDLRDQKLVDLQLPPDFFDSIRRAQVELGDLGNAAKQQTRDIGAENRLLTEALRDRIRSEQLIQQLQNKRLTDLERERSLLELQAIAIAQIARARAAANTTDPSFMSRLAGIETAPVTPQDLGQAENPALENAVRLNRLILDHLRDRVALEKAVETVEDDTSTELQKQVANLQGINLLLERQRRLAEFVRLGGDPAKLDAANKIQLEAADLSRRQNAELQRQVEMQRLLQAEISARIELERASNVLSDRKSTILERQAALLRMQTIATERRQRDERATQLGVPENQIARIRGAAVATRDLGNEAKRAASGLRELGNGAAAANAALALLIVQGLRQSAAGLRQMGAEILDDVGYFERLALGVGFFTARSLEGGAAALSYKEKIAATAEETQGLLVWLQRIAVSSPFTTKDVGNLFRTSQAYGLLRKEAEVLTPLLVDFASAAGLDSDVLERLALAIGQVRSRGKLTGEEVRQLGNSGVPIRDILVKTLGIANDEFDELIESGAITSDIAIPAIIKALKEFEGAGKAIAFETIGGIISAFEDLRQIASAKFFTAALNPLKESLQEFFELTSDPSTTAFIQVLGEEVGVRLKAGFDSLRQSVTGMIAAWQALSPATKQQVFVFGAATVAIFAATAAMGLMILTVNALATPLVGLTLTAAFLVSEWTSGFAVMSKATAGAVDFIGDLITDMAKWGGEVASMWARSFGEAASLIGEFAGVVASGLAYWFKPNSPPNVAPDLDKWGKEGGQIYLDGYAEANPETPLNKLGEVVSQGMSRVTTDAIHAGLKKFQELNPEVTVQMSRELNIATRKAYGVVVDNIGDVLGGPKAQAAAKDAGFKVSRNWIDGFRILLPTIKAIIDPELQEALDALGGGESLSAAGAMAFTKYLSGYKEGDFGVLEEAAGIVEGFLQNLVDRGELSEGDMLAQLFGTRQDIAAAIKEFREAGRISDETLDKVAASSWEAGEAVRDLLVSYQEFARTDDILTEAQKNLDAITKQYADTLKPLRAELERISELRTRGDEEEEILSLRRLINNEAVSARRKEQAQLKIAEILQGRKVRGLEKEEKAATDVAQTQVDAAQKAQKEAQEQLALVKAQINAQLTQLGLVGEEAKLMQKLREEIEKLQEKQKTPLDLQGELVKLQQAELADLEKAAKAKYTLDQADSSELEKQNAILDLQEVALNRQQRLVEARKLGIPESELTKLYDFSVTLDDIGVKTKKDFSDLAAGLGDLETPAVNAKEEFAKWEAELEKARIKIGEVKQGLKDTFTEINNNLPSWLKIFPEKEGEEPPILVTLRKYGESILWVGAVIISSKILQSLATLVGLLRAIAGSTIAQGLAGLASKAIEGIGPAAAGSVTGIDALMRSLGILTAGFIAARLAAQGLGAAYKALGIQQEIAQSGVFGESVQLEVEGLSEALADSVGVGNAGIAAPIIGKAIRDAFTTAIEQGLSNEETVAAVDKALGTVVGKNKVVGDTPENRALIEQFRERLSNILGSQRPEGGAVVEVPVTPSVTLDESTPIIDPNAQLRVQSVISNTVLGAVQKGLSETDIKKEVALALNNGIASGMLPEATALDAAAVEFMNVLIQAYKDAGEIQSPSARSAREIGVPIGEGILAGTLAALDAGAGESGDISMRVGTLLALLDTLTAGLNQRLTTAVDQMSTKLTATFDALYTTLTTRAGDIERDVMLAANSLSSRWKLSTLLLQNYLLARFAGIGTDAIEQTTAMKIAVVQAFADMRSGAQTEGDLLRQYVQDTFIGSKSSQGLVQMITVAFLGEDGNKAFLLGATWMKTLADGIASGQFAVADALVGSLTYALGQAQTALASSPITNGQTGAGLGAVQNQLASKPSAIYPAGSTVINNTRNFYLTVNSAAQSQGVIRDFGIMETMAGST